jgi:hypothetical protein
LILKEKLERNQMSFHHRNITDLEVASPEGILTGLTYGRTTGHLRYFALDLIKKEWSLLSLEEKKDLRVTIKWHFVGETPQAGQPILVFSMSKPGLIERPKEYPGDSIKVGSEINNVIKSKLDRLARDRRYLLRWPELQAKRRARPLPAALFRGVLPGVSRACSLPPAPTVPLASTSPPPPSRSSPLPSSVYGALGEFKFDSSPQGNIEDKASMVENKSVLPPPAFVINAHKLFMDDRAFSCFSEQMREED